MQRFNLDWAPPGFEQYLSSGMPSNMSSGGGYTISYSTSRESKPRTINFTSSSNLPTNVFKVISTTDTGDDSEEFKMTSRYSSGWSAPDQYRKPVTRVARAAQQSFLEIRDRCLQEGILFEDPEFPAVDSSVYYSSPQRFQWKRPHELCAEPHMYVDGASRFDIKQGDLGNCWFLASVASLCASGNRSETKDILNKVICMDNAFSKNYAGVVHFNIWQYGKWVDVVIDDRLPTLNGRLVFMHSGTENEFWSALLEKAYAKLNGSYEALRGGCSSEAMEDLTGGLVETFNLAKQVPDNLWTLLVKGYEKRSLMACQIEAAPSQIESVLNNGLIIGHAYSITGAKELHIGGRKEKLLRIRNPWGNQYEWKGAWGDSSPQWNSVSQSEREEMGLTFGDDGEFWMSYNDFIANYQKVEICNLGPDSLLVDHKRKWECTMHDGSWKAKVNAGGCRNFLDTFWTNPQYRVEVVDPDEDDGDVMGTVIVALMQKERRKKKREGLDYLTIGLTLYKIDDPNVGPLDLNFFKYNAAAARSTYSNMREICQRFKLAPGHYVIIPSTFKPNEEADFLVRIYSERGVDSSEIDEETTITDTSDQAIKDLEARGQDPSQISQNMPKTAMAFTSPPVVGHQMSQIETARRMRKARTVTESDVNQEREAKAIFRRTAGEDMEVDCFELKSILDSHFMKEFSFDGFSLDTCRSMVAMMDVDKSGKLGYEEFKKQWVELRKWKKIFLEFDADKSGTFNSFELRAALNSAGIKVSNSTFNALVMRYADRDGRIYFDDFIHCAVRIKTMFEIFQDMSPTPGGPAVFNMDAFIQTTMYS